jgi:hypothetical protein
MVYTIESTTQALGVAIAVQYWEGANILFARLLALYSPTSTHVVTFPRENLCH